MPSGEDSLITESDLDRVDFQAIFDKVWCGGDGKMDAQPSAGRDQGMLFPSSLTALFVDGHICKRVAFFPIGNLNTDEL